MFQNTVILKEIELRYDELLVRPFALLIVSFICFVSRSDFGLKYRSDPSSL